MTAIAVTAANVSRIFPQQDEILTVKLAETVTAGQAAYQLAAGTFGLADANASGRQQFRGIFLEGGAANAYVPMLVKGIVSGYTVSGLNGDAPLYLSDTAGSLDDTAGTMTVVCGRVYILPDATPTKVVYIDARWAQIWS